mmetsp:Transcript_13188/g.23483  ORF Transcript_13188/g.23483 Transcript_13188/m.23483 type:complete len:115 (+) Transcript_13188:1540-1884(+)
MQVGAAVPQGVLMTGLLALGVGGLYLVARGRLGKVRNFGPPSQRRRPRPGSAAAASATGSLFRFPTWAELSGALPHREGEQDTGYELQLRVRLLPPISFLSHNLLLEFIALHPS